jgi:hypothetical protein
MDLHGEQAMREFGRLAATGIAIALALPASAHAGACEDSFRRTGSVISGVHFIATATVPDLPPDLAINQMRGIAARKGYDIMASEPAAGALLIEQPVSGNSRAFPIEINATQENGMGTVRMEAKLRAAMAAPTEGAKTEMCAMLAELRGGRAGRTAAASGARATTVQSAPIALNSLELSHQISKDTERNPAAILPRYSGKRFTISGQVDYITQDSGTYRVAFKIPNPWEEAIRLPGTAAFKTDLSCMMAAGQSVYALQLKPGRSIRLTGTFFRFNETGHHVWFTECRPAP